MLNLRDINMLLTMDELFNQVVICLKKPAFDGTELGDAFLITACRA